LKKAKTKKEPSRFLLRKIAVMIFLALIGYTAADGYFNEWKQSRRLLHWNKLELKEHDDAGWQLVAHRDFQLIEIPDVRTITFAESLLVFDQPLCDSGYYRLYFRFSDTASGQLQKMVQTITSLDTAGILRKSVEDAKRAYQNFQHLFGTSPAPPRDTPVVRVKDSTKQLASLNLSIGPEDEATEAVKKLFGNSQVVLGLGIGIVVSAGVEMFRGDAYCAIAKSDIFRLDSLRLGAYAGRWEGMPIDILWAMKKKQQQY